MHYRFWGLLDSCLVAAARINKAKETAKTPAAKEPAKTPITPEPVKPKMTKTDVTQHINALKNALKN